MLTEITPPVDTTSLAGQIFESLDDDARDWLRRALIHSAHGCDLFIGKRMGSEDDALQAFWGAGWIQPAQFAPDLAQRAFGAFGGGSMETVAAHFGHKPMAYWWKAGPNASSALELLPPPKDIAPGDNVRYAPEFLRSIGMSGSDLAVWRGVVLRLTCLSTITLAYCEGPREEVCSCGKDPECRCCAGAGVTRIRPINTGNLRRVKS